MLIFWKYLAPEYFRRLPSLWSPSSVVSQLYADIDVGKDIVISEQATNGPTLRDQYPFVALGDLMAMRPCHETIYYPDQRYRVHHIEPDAFAGDGKSLPGTLTLWRYQDDWKFKDLLESKSLHLSGLEYLQDPLEGSPTESLRQMVAVAEGPGGGLFGKLLNFSMRQMLGNRSMFDWFQAFYKECCVSCWHLGQEESMPLWNSCKTTRAVAIRTTVRAVRECVHDRRNLSTWKVHYLDYEATKEKADRILDYKLEHLASHKEKLYSFENEFRIVHFNYAAFRARMNTKRWQNQPERECVRLPVDLPNLIHEVRLHPAADISFIEEIENLVREKLPNVQVRRSNL